jgi:ribonuclease BN (tRNA processing enzyme)
MIVTLVGTGTGVPSIRRNPACILVKLNDKHLVFDSGPGTLKALLQCNVDYLNIDFLFYTHFHMDHISDMGALLFAAKIPPDERKKTLTIYGPKGLKDYYARLLDLYKNTITGDTYRLELKEIENASLEIEGFKISSKPLKHHGGSMGYRITSPDNKVLVYSGDTDYCDEAIELSMEADLCILECSFPDELKMKGHLAPSEAGKIAKKAGVKKLALVHMYPVCDRYDLRGACQKEFKGEIVVPEDLTTFEV